MNEYSLRLPQSLLIGDGFAAVPPLSEHDNSVRTIVRGQLAPSKTPALMHHRMSKRRSK